MIAEIEDTGLAEVAPLSLLEEVRSLRVGLAADRLREVQALAGAFASMLEGRAATVDDLLNIDRLFTSACHRTGEALHTMGATLSCEGIA